MHNFVQNTHNLSNKSDSKPASCFDTQFDMHDPYGVINSSGGVVIHTSTNYNAKRRMGIWREGSGGGNEIHSVVHPKVLSVWINAQEKNSVWGGNLENGRKNTAKTHLLPRIHFVLSPTKQNRQRQC